MEKVMMDMKTTLPKDTIHTVDAGNFALWVNKYQEFGTPDTLFGPTVGCMGYGVPAAIANCGDGGFPTTGQEMATAIQYGVNIITVAYNKAFEDGFSAGDSVVLTESHGTFELDMQKRISLKAA